jgi:hypothetical protein
MMKRGKTPLFSYTFLTRFLHEKVKNAYFSLKQNNGKSMDKPRRCAFFGVFGKDKNTDKNIKIILLASTK